MPTLQIFQQAEFPDHFKWQAVTLMRCQWPSIFVGGMRFINQPYPPELGPIHVVLSEQDVLISYADLLPLRLPRHEEQLGSLKLLGFGNMLTSPPYRGEGHGRQVLQAASEHADRSGADLALLFCNPNLEGYYGQVGWSGVPACEVRIGTPESYTLDQELLMGRFITPGAQALREQLERLPLYVEWAW